MLDAKIKKIQVELRKQKLHGLIIGNFGHQIADDLLYYLLLKKLELGLLYIPARGMPTLWGIPFEIAMMKRAYGRHINILPYSESASELLASQITRKSRLGYRESAMPAQVWRKLRTLKKCSWEAFEDKEIRAIKLPEEIKRMRIAAQSTDRLFRELVLAWPTFKRESDAARFLVARMIALGVEHSFPTIIASGRSAADPHHVTTDEKIQKGFCVIDMGVRYQGYCSDMTRTVYVGRPTEPERHLYTALQKIQAATLLRVRAGRNTSEIDAFCRTSLGTALDKQFIHGLGHGVGTQVHEWPSVTKAGNATLKERMVITIEPGVYKKNAYGIRIEDDVLVRKDGREVLTRSSKKLKVIM